MLPYSLYLQYLQMLGSEDDLTTRIMLRQWFHSTDSMGFRIIEVILGHPSFLHSDNSNQRDMKIFFRYIHLACRSFTRFIEKVEWAIETLCTQEEPDFVLSTLKIIRLLFDYGQMTEHIQGIGEAVPKYYPFARAIFGKKGFWKSLVRLSRPGSPSQSPFMDALIFQRVLELIHHGLMGVIARIPEDCPVFMKILVQNGIFELLDEGLLPRFAAFGDVFGKSLCTTILVPVAQIASFAAVVRQLTPMAI